MFIHSVLCAYILATSQATMHWSIANTPIIYGKNIVLTCETGKTLLNGNCPVRQWFSGPQYKQLIYNSYPSIKTKYEDRTNLSTTHFSLVIKNCTEADLNINYTCSCGFESYTKNLSINEDNFVVQPERKNVTFEENNRKLSIKIELLRVYPRPKCYAIIGSRRIDTFSIVKNIKSITDGISYDFCLEEDVILGERDCKKNPEIVCDVGKLHAFITVTGEEIHNCIVKDKVSINTTVSVEPPEEDQISQTEKIIVPIVVFAVAGLVVCIGIIINKRGRQIGTRSTTLNLSSRQQIRFRDRKSVV